MCTYQKRKMHNFLASKYHVLFKKVHVPGSTFNLSAFFLIQYDFQTKEGIVEMCYFLRSHCNSSMV